MNDDHEKAGNMKLYRKNYPIFYTLLLILLALSNRQRAVPPMGKYYSMKDICPQSVDGIKDLQAPLETPGLLIEPDDLEAIVRKFDVNRYFEILDYLSVEDGYYLSHLYFSDLAGGEPVLYAVPVGSDPIYSYKAYKEYITNGTTLEETISLRNISDDYLNHIVVEDTPEGFFQYAVLYELGDQFQLRWHANYDDDIILCDSNDLELVRTALENFRVASTRADIQIFRAYLLNLSPYVVMGRDTVSVSLITFTKWGGFEEKNYTFARSFPHEIIDISTKTLLAYNCHILF